jgi:hypothetical protein
MTDCGASRRPVTSSHSVTGRSSTSATLTFGAGGVAAVVEAGLRSQAARKGMTMPAKARVARERVQVERGWDRRGWDEITSPAPAVANAGPIL